MKKENNLKLNEFLLRKEFINWSKNNPDIVDDIINLVNELMMFDIKYGTNISKSFKKRYQTK